MRGVIANFRGGRHTQYNRQMIVLVEGRSKKEEVEDLIGKDVEWKSPAGKVIKGKVSAVHGSKGAVRVIFEKGMPGQSIGQDVEIRA